MKSHYPPIIHVLNGLVLVCSVFIVILFYSGKFHKDPPPTPLSKFGCTFTSPDYALEPHPPLHGDLAPPVWGDEVPPLVLSSEEELVALIQHLEEIQRQVSEMLHYNSIDNLIRFYAAYKSSGQNFASFYAGYQPRYSPRENCIGLAIEVLDRAHAHLSPRWPHIASHTYLSSCRINITKTWLGTVHREWGKGGGDKEGDVLMGRYLKHALATLKIEVKGRLGYIIMDQGFAWESPGVLMLDEKNPHYAVIPSQDNDELYELNMVFNSSSILWEIVASDHSHVREAHLIYTRRPYCSFLTSSEKRDLIRPLRSVIRRDRLGQIVGGAYFYTWREVEGTGLPEVVMLRATPDREKERWPIPLAHLSEAGIQKGLANATDLAMLDSVNYLLNLGPGVLLSKLQHVGSIMNDAEFLQGCKDMDIELNKKDVAFRGEYAQDFFDDEPRIYEEINDGEVKV